MSLGIVWVGGVVVGCSWATAEVAIRNAAGQSAASASNGRAFNGNFCVPCGIYSLLSFKAVFLAMILCLRLQVIGGYRHRGFEAEVAHALVLFVLYLANKARLLESLQNCIESAIGDTGEFHGFGNRH